MQLDVEVSPPAFVRAQVKPKCTCSVPVVSQPTKQYQKNFLLAGVHVVEFVRNFFLVLDFFFVQSQTDGQTDRWTDGQKATP